MRKHRALRALAAIVLFSDDHGHDGDSWANNLHHFAQRIFRQAGTPHAATKEPK